jgi:hypothetical protein
MRHIRVERNHAVRRKEYVVNRGDLSVIPHLHGYHWHANKLINVAEKWIRRFQIFRDYLFEVVNGQCGDVVIRG